MASPPAPPASDRLEQLARDTGRAAPYTNDLVDGLPEPVRRYFGHAISPGTPLAAGAHISMRGRIKLQRWLPFRARQVLVPCHGTVWAARIAGVISGSDRYVGGTGGLDWRLFGRIPLVHAEGDDVTRSAAERAAGESIWVPTALLPGSGADWSALDENSVAVAIAVDGHAVRLHHHIDDHGRIRTSTFQRWGDPDNQGRWAPHPFGLEVTQHRTFAGVTIPAAGRAGWHFGTDRWESGVFFRYEITAYRLITPYGHSAPGTEP